MVIVLRPAKPNKPERNFTHRTATPKLVELEREIDADVLTRLRVQNTFATKNLEAILCAQAKGMLTDPVYEESRCKNVDMVVV